MTIIHDYLYCYILEKCKNEHISLSRLLYHIKSVVRVPKTMDRVLLKEMERKGLIKRINHQTYYICRDTKQCKISIEKIKDYKDFVFW